MLGRRYTGAAYVTDETGERGKGMADFLEQVLSDEEPVETPVADEPVQVETRKTEEPQEPVQPAPAEEPQEPVQPTKPENGFVPIAAMLDERDRRKALEAQLQQFQQQAPRQQVEIPDPLDDPQGHYAYLEAQMEQRLAAERFKMSDIMARQAHGAEAVETAVQWAQQKAQQDPMFAASYMREAHPLDWIVQQHKRDSFMSQIGDVSSIDDWIAQEAAKRGYVMQSAPVAAAPVAVPQAPKPAAPPRSIASDASSSAPVAPDVKAEFEAIFNQR